MFKKILSCLDGSLLSEQILPYAADEAISHQARLILIRVSIEPIIASPAIPGAPSVPLEIPTMEKAAVADESEAQTYLKIKAAELDEQRNISAETVVIPGNPGEAVVAYAWENEVDLIALATHGHSGLGKAVFGSVADYVIKKSGLPILLIKPS